MASGTIDLGTSGYLTGRITWSSVSNGSTANTSTVTATIQAKRTNEYTTTGTWTGNLKIGSTTKTYSVYKAITNSWVTLLSFSVTINHNDNGTGSCLISGVINAPSGTSMAGITLSKSATVTLDTIPRYATAEQSLQSKTETTAVMKWTSDSVVDYIWYSIDNGSTWSGINVADGKSGTYTISGLSANTNYKIKTKVRRKDSQLTTISSALSVTTYNYPYATKMPNFTIGEKFTMEFYNPLSRTISINIIANGTQIANTYTTSGTSYTGFSAASSINQLYATIPTLKKANYNVKVTYGSSQITKTGGTFSINENNCKPAITDLTYLDTNSTTVAITGDDQKIIRNQSIVSYTASGLETKYSATISSVVLSINANSYNLTVSGSSATGGNAVIDSSIDIDATVVLTDSRGLKAQKTITVTMENWVLPTGIITLHRSNNYYTETILKVNASYSSLDGENSVTIQYRYKKTTDSSYNAYTTIQDDVETTINLDNKYDWNVRINVADIFGSTTYNLILPKGMPIMFFDTSKNSVGVNCFPSDDKSFEIDDINILDALMFKAGDTFTLDGATVCGMISGGSEDVNFTIVLPKSMANVIPSITELRSNIRIPAGGYLFGSFVSGGYNVLTDSTLYVAINKINDYMLRVIITKSSAFSVTNNTPLAVTLDNVEISFS